MEYLARLVTLGVCPPLVLEVQTRRNWILFDQSSSFSFDQFRVQRHVTIQYTWLCDHVIMINTVQYSKGHLHVVNVFVYCNKDHNFRSFSPFVINVY